MTIDFTSKTVRSSFLLLKTGALAFLICLTIGGNVASAQSGSYGNINLLLGQRTLDTDDWSPVEEQAMGALEVDYNGGGWPVNVLAGIAYSNASEDETLWGQTMTLTGSTTEAYAGVRKYFNLESGLFPYVSAGVSWISAEAEVEHDGGVETEDDSGFGGFLGVGIIYRIDSFHIGLNSRVLVGTTLDFNGVEGTADHTQFAVVAGTSF